jgi:MYXO-CTERM domain-containing protein
VQTESVSAAAAPIIGGGPDTNDVAVVALVQQSTGTLCSGTIIAPQVVLTAAHCVYRVDASDLQVLVGPDDSTPTQTIAVASVAAYPTYSDEDTGLQGGVDLGVAFLATPANVTPATAATSPAAGDFAGAEVTLVGYGIDSTASGTGAGMRRSVSLPVDSVCSRLLTVGGLDADACFGDSGGAVLLGGALVAVISSGMGDCATPSLMTRLDAHADWISAILAGGDAGAACPTCVPADPSCGAATETQAASDGDAGLHGSSGAPAAPGGSGGGGGCAIEPAGTDRSSGCLGVLGLLAAVTGWSWRRRRSPVRA